MFLTLLLAEEVAVWLMSVAGSRRNVTNISFFLSVAFDRMKVKE
jgi:hypothetical protein